MNTQISVEQIHNRLRPIQQKFVENIGIVTFDSPPEKLLYYIKKDGVKTFNKSKYERNKLSFEKFRSLIRRFYTLYVPIEFFEGKILFNKPNSDWDDNFRHQVMTSMMIDTFISSLDIYSIIIIVYYKNVKPESLGFSYKNFLKPIKEFSQEIFNESNKLYKTLKNSDVKNYRDSEKHFGFTTYNLNSMDSRRQTSFYQTMKKDEISHLKKLRDETFSMLDVFLNLLDLSINEMCKHKLGYENPNDKILKVNNDGTYSLYT